MRVATLIGTAALLVSTTAQAQTVSYDYDRTADFSAIRTYAWVGGNLEDELNHQRVLHAVDAQLSAKGLRRVEASDHPDVVLAYHAAFGREVQVSGSGWGGYRLSRSGSARVEEVLVGALALQIADAQTGNLVWRGMAQRDVDTDATPEQRDKNINKAVEKLLKHYPSSTKHS
jgi:hypothetical protein